jgi:serine/threonine protein kinase/cytochrome c5
MSSQYKPIRKIAVGGMAEVLLGLQQGIEGFEKLVVIKRILPHLRDDEEFVRMFLAEARLAASLRHHNIVETLDIHRDQESFFIALEYISGEDLRYLIANRRKRNDRVPVRIACRIIADIAAALDHAHNAKDIEGNPRGIVHRDVGPSNILVSYDGFGKLVDFGVAKANAANVYTRPGVLKGKFGYMSPEQVQQMPVDHRADIFSLGVVMHELLTGQRLFKAKTVAAVIKRLLDDVPPPVSEINPDVPPLLDRVIAEALNKDPEARTPSSATLRDQMEQVLSEIGACSHADVAAFMQGELASRWERRKLVEREVVLAGRKSISQMPTLADSSLPKAGFDAPGDNKAIDEAAGSYATSGSLGGIGSAPLIMPGRTAYTGPHANPSGVALGHLTGAQLAGAEYTGSRIQQTSNRRSVLFMLLGAVGALVVVGAVVAGFMLGRSGDGKHAVASTDQTTNRTETRSSTNQAAQPEQPTATLIVHVYPAGVSVSLEGKEAAIANPQGVMVPIAAGKPVTLSLKKTGYKPVEQTVKLKAGAVQHIHVNLQQLEASVVATAVNHSATSKAGQARESTSSDNGSSADNSGQVGRNKGSNNARRKARARRRPRRRGRRRVAVRRKRRSAKVAPAATAGQLMVAFSPKSARVLVDNKRISGGSPVKLNNLLPGKHIVVVSAKAHKTVRQVVQVEAGHAYAVTINLQSTKKALARLDLISNPAGATISINGESRGKAPLLGLSLAASKSYTVVATLPGHKSWVSRITPAAGRNPPIMAILKPAGVDAVASSKKTAPPKVAALTLARSSKGNAGKGRGLFNSRCNSCHGRSVAAISPTRYTRAQWKRYFAHGRHRVRAPLAKHVSRAQLAHIKAYLISRAADVAGATAAGVR